MRAKSGTTRNPDRTRQKILKEATRIFAQKGYNGAALSDIVSATKVNKRMIYHYFGDKYGLYRSVIRQQWFNLKDWVDQSISNVIENAQINAEPFDANKLLQDAIEVISDYMAERQEFVRLMMWDGLEGGNVANDIWDEVRGPFFVQVEFLLKQAQKADVLKKDLDPAQLIISYLGMIGFYFAYAPTLNEMLHKEPLSKPALAERKKHLLTVLKHLSGK